MFDSRKLTGRQIADFCILLILAAISISYLFDTYQASHHPYNLIFVAPLCIVIFVICLFELVAQLKGSSPPPPDLEPISSLIPAIGAFTFYILTLNWLGFDVGTALFIGIFLWLHGERRFQWIIGYSIAFAILTAYFFSKMLPYPLPMLLIPTQY